MSGNSVWTKVQSVLYSTNLTRTQIGGLIGLLFISRYGMINVAYLWDWATVLISPPRSIPLNGSTVTTFTVGLNDIGMYI